MMGPGELELEEDVVVVGSAVPSEVMDGGGVDVADDVTSRLVVIDVGVAEEAVEAVHLLAPVHILFPGMILPIVAVVD